MTASDHLNPRQFGDKQGLGVSAMPKSSKYLSPEEEAQYTHLFDQAHARQREVSELERMWDE